MKILEKIKEVKDLFKDKSKWTQGACARDSKGMIVNTLSENACSFCWAGACCKVTDDIFSNVLIHEFEIDLPKDFYSISLINDWQGYDKVMEQIDKTIHKFTDWNKNNEN